MGRLVLLTLLVLANGCSLSLNREKEGLLAPVRAARQYESSVGKVTLTEVLAEIGSPDLILAAGKRTRIYYAYYDSLALRGSMSTIVPVAGGLRPTVAFGSKGGEMLELARLDFDENGVLRDAQFAVMPLSKGGTAAAVDSRVVGFYEDRDRLLRLQDPDIEEDIDEGER